MSENSTELAARIARHILGIEDQAGARRIAFKYHDGVTGEREGGGLNEIALASVIEDCLLECAGGGWTDLDSAQPDDGQVVTSGIKGGEGDYAAGCRWDDANRQFRTYRRHSNRTVITIWHHNQRRRP